MLCKCWNLPPIPTGVDCVHPQRDSKIEEEKTNMDPHAKDSHHELLLRVPESMSLSHNMHHVQY